MKNAPSRRQKRLSRFYYLAEKGYMVSNDFYLFKSEESNLRNNYGFNVTRYGTDLTKELPSSVSWEEPFQNEIPLIVIDYCMGRTNTFPKSAIENLAQELFVIATRANYEKGTKQ